MPTNPTTPNANAAIDRLALGVDTPRGEVLPAWGGTGQSCICFEAEPANLPFPPFCFEAEASSITFMCSCGCFEAE